MKAGILLAAVAAIGVALWFSGLLTPPSRHLLITGASASPAANEGTAAVLSIDNQGAPDKLVGVRSSLGDAWFQNADHGLPIPTGTSSLALDGAHIIVVPSEAVLEDGALVPLTLDFEAAGEVSVKARFEMPEPGSMAAHMAMGHGAMKHEVIAAPLPTVSLSVVPNGQGWTARIQTENFTFSEALQDSDHVPGTGHGHIYIGAMKLGRIFSRTYDIGALPKGQHLLRVTLNTNDHRSYVVDGNPVEAEAIIAVD